MVSAMPETTPPNPAESGLEVRTHFVRSRNVLVARADFSELFVDYYLHLAAQKIRPAPEHDALFKRALAAFVLHAASRPWDEMTAWTVNFQEPLVNLFLTGDNGTGAVTGRVFDENVKELPENLFYADVVRGQQPKRRSTVSFESADPLAAVEKFYLQSEQRTGRYFQLGEEEFALVTEHPDADLAWLRALTAEQVRRLEETETVVPMERRIARWHCGCNQARMMEVLAPAMREDPDELFGSEAVIEIRCPRCGARHAITREALEAFVSEVK
ncbi:MAG: disulfide bond chaperone [Verrucomicrobia bacterium]|nr:disulfide bond chaperone [Verrucomicrobiota bacterium]